MILRQTDNAGHSQTKTEQMIGAYKEQFPESLPETLQPVVAMPSSIARNQFSIKPADAIEISTNTVASPRT